MSFRPCARKRIGRTLAHRDRQERKRRIAEDLEHHAEAVAAEDQFGPTRPMRVILGAAGSGGLPDATEMVMAAT